MADGGSVYVPIVFMDGDTKITGVRVNPSAKYNDLESGLSSRLGISPNQIRVYILPRKPNSLYLCWESFITAKFNFPAIVRERVCVFVVVFKRIQENPKPRQGGGELSGHDSPNYNEVAGLEFVDDGDENSQILQTQQEKPERREGGGEVSGQDSRNYIKVSGQEFVDDDDDDDENLDILQIEQGKKESLMENDRPFCEECAGANGKGTSEPFHLCKYDAVIERFRTEAGPIARPSRPSYLN
ncbi:hypothetical protein U1Q18_008072 [Sarracenia purpurea var. burkii]